MTSRTRYIVKETLISAAINTALSICFAFLAFHGQSKVPLSGRHGIVADMAPQTFMVVFMSCLVPGLLTRRRLRTGTLSWHPAKQESVLSAVYIAALVTAAVGTCLVVATCSVILPHLLPSGISFAPLLAGKALFGMLLAAMVTPWGLVKALR
jgi:hypothetical protein